ncbi:tol-pal system protein YbgF [Afifella sp. IM 167]|uniref:tol-pal system protein YbgF n=1 Tax=Afifella sp. IM 167 TaxID=2033586 RepID=UPI001CD00C26|nr:tol-pal system protein YbgF [Afifella sp. IM 167]MBZ8135359.1 tol-pal system protein YbgF [Afifella sp. IM 167]
MSGRFLLVFAALLLAPGLAQAQSAQQMGQMNLYIQQLEQRVRELTGEVERLQHELRETRRQAGIAAPAEGGAGSGQPMDQGLGGQNQFGAAQPGNSYGVPTGSGSMNPDANSSQMAGAPPQDLGTFGISPDDPRIAPDGATSDPLGNTGMDSGGLATGNNGGAPIDLSVLAGGGNGGGFNGSATTMDPSMSQSGSMGGAVGAVPPSASGGDVGGPAASDSAALASLSGDPRQDYDFAYGYILTGDYADAERSFSAWLERFPKEPQATDARFWLGESLLQQNKNRDAANAFLEVYKSSPDSRKAPDALMKLGVALAALGEKDAACATFDEVTRKYPNASGALSNRVASEAQRAGC